MQARRFIRGLLLVAGLVSGCGGAEVEAGDAEPVMEQNLSRCESGCHARYNFCIYRGIQPPEVCRDELFSCLEECEILGLEVPGEAQQ